MDQAWERELLENVLSTRGQYSRFECKQCRVGKATCAECGVEGFLSEETDGLVRCGVKGCGRAFHRTCQ